MNLPQIELIPLRPVVSSDRPSTLDLFVKIVPPAQTLDFKRPALNIGLVIDRSGSMSGRKIEEARQAACYAVEQLQMSDRISITVFDDQVETLVPSTPAIEKSSILAFIASIQPGGSTALHAGWLQGGVQVSQYFNPEHINRVLLLSDGLANVGETNPDTIATDVHGLAKRAVSTSTMGIQRVTFQLPAVPFAQLEEFPPNPEVQQQVARLMAARAKEEAVRNLDRGNFAAARASLQVARAQMMGAPVSPRMAMELKALEALDTDLAAKDVKRARKRATYQNYQARRGEGFSS